MLGRIPANNIVHKDQYPEFVKNSHESVRKAGENPVTEDRI